MQPIERARLALEGLSVGDAFGQRFFGAPEIVVARIAEREVPPGPWHWTDDTAMGLSVYEILAEVGHVDRDRLARRFAERYRREPHRGYGGTAHGILARIGAGDAWQVAAGEVFDGGGSMGNGAAMRVAPVGGFFADDLDAVVRESGCSADPTHAHPDGKAGAIAVGVAAAMAWRKAEAGELLREVFVRTPDGPTREGIDRAMKLGTDADPRTAASALGTGSLVISSDTVPFALWCAARHLADFEEAMWTTVGGLGDRDTTCAIVGGIVALSVGLAGIPDRLRTPREPLQIP